MVRSPDEGAPVTARCAAASNAPDPSGTVEPAPDERHRLLVIGASAGGVEALRVLVGTLPPRLDAAVYVVLHVPAGVRSALVDLLDRSGPLPARAAHDLDTIQHGAITVAPPDHHLLVKQDWVRVVRGPRENGHRPAVDPLFRSAAAAHGDATVALVLSGALDDGAVGAAHVQRAGGRVFVQDPEEAMYPGMPCSVLDAVTVDGVLPLAQLAPALVTALERPLGPAPADSPELDAVEAIVGDGDRPWETAGSGVVTCPSCGGPMLEQDAQRAGLSGTYRCRVGHAWSLDRLVDEQRSEVERSLWSAIRVLEERSDLDWRLAARATDRGHERAAATYRQQARESLEEARRLQALLRRDDQDLEDVEATEA